MASAFTSSDEIDVEEVPKLGWEEQVEEALQMADSKLTQEYFRAKEVVPSLVRNETRIQDFLSVENNDPVKAAERLARHWKTRKLLFGDRWLLPMTQTGAGALTPAQVEILRSGFHTVICSDDGSCYALCDFAALPKGASHMQIEILFYFLTRFSGTSRTVYVVRGESGPCLQMSPLVKLALDSCAYRPAPGGAVVVKVFEEGKEHLLDFLAYRNKRISETNCRIPVTIVEANSMRDSLRQLEARGFNRARLPRYLGGCLDVSFFANWIRERLSVEGCMSAAPIVQNHLRLPSVPSDSSLVVASAAKRKQRRRESLELVKREGESAAEFAKRKNAVYVRRNYYRQKLELMTAESEVAQQRTLNENLRVENARLKQLMTEATWWVCNVEATRLRQGDTSGNLGGSVNNDFDSLSLMGCEWETLDF